MSRPKGSKNRAEQQLIFIRKVERYLKESSPEEYGRGDDALARKCARILKDGDHKTSTLLLGKLVPYKIGLPTQPIEMSGSLDLAGVVQRARERAAKRGSGNTE